MIRLGRLEWTTWWKKKQNGENGEKKPQKNGITARSRRQCDILHTNRALCHRIITAVSVIMAVQWINDMNKQNHQEHHHQQQITNQSDNNWRHRCRCESIASRDFGSSIPSPEPTDTSRNQRIPATTATVAIKSLKSQPEKGASASVRRCRPENKWVFHDSYDLIHHRYHALSCSSTTRWDW